MEVTTYYLLPHEQWLVDRSDRWLQRVVTDPDPDAVKERLRNGPESSRLDSAYFVDFQVAVLTVITGFILMFVIGRVFHGVGAGFGVGFSIVGIGLASFTLAHIRMLQSSRARREYRRISPFTDE